MKNDWLAAATFEQTHEVVSAINTLSIHAKLLLAAVPDPAPVQELEGARERLLAFVERIRAVLGEADRDGRGAIVGVDPVLDALAQQVLSEERRGSARPSLRELRLAELPALVKSERPDDLRRLTSALQQLRALLGLEGHTPRPESSVASSS
jgi:hypothetical protein